MAQSLEVGQLIQAWCPKCEAVKKHAITALKGTRAGRTECSVCKDVHAYRKNPPGSRRSASSGPKISDYELAMADRDPAEAVAYKISGTYAKDQVLQHKKFGIGIVARVMSDLTMDVLFEDKPRALIHNR